MSITESLLIATGAVGYAGILLFLIEKNISGNFPAWPGKAWMLLGLGFFVFMMARVGS